jgi:hypothetical protein
MELTNFLFLYLVDPDYLYDSILDGCYDEDSQYIEYSGWTDSDDPTNTDASSLLD